MTVKCDLIIVGGGIVGAACARELSRLGGKVLLIDDGERGGEAWRASAGMLAPQVEAAEEDDLLDLGLAGREYFSTSAEWLAEATGIDIGLWQGGILKTAATTGEADRLRHQVAWQRQHGHHADWLDPAEIREQWPWLGPSEGGLWAPHDGSVNPVAATQAFLADATLRGVHRVHDRITTLELDPRGRVSGVAGAERYSTEQVVIAAGAWSGRIRGLPRPLSVEPVRGQMIAFPWPGEVPPGVYMGDGIYALHRSGELHVGATMEHRGFANATTPSGEQRLTDGIRALFPGLVPGDPIRSWAGLRPGTPDGLPILGREPLAEGLWYATGHGRNGVLLAGVTGAILAQLFKGEEPFADIAPFRPERFWDWSIDHGARAAPSA